MGEKSRRLVLALTTCLVTLLVVACDVKTQPPPQIEESDLVGFWETKYSRTMTDTLQLRSDGTFKQLYEDRARGYVFETPWNAWWIERLPNQLIRIHLEGAKYFLESPTLHDGEFYDPYAHEFLHPVKELVLHVRMDSKGELLLEHVWTYGAQGFAIIGGEAQRFRRAESLTQ
jgi:hypothetical protein